MTLVKAAGASILVIPGGLVPKGAYDAGTDYAVGDSVDYLGSSYVMYVDAAAGTLPTDTTKWQVIANKGATGANGADGAQGPKGDTGDASGNSGTIISGDGVTDGSWRSIIVGTDLVIQRLEGGNWIEKGRNTA